MLTYPAILEESVEVNGIVPVATEETSLKIQSMFEYHTETNDSIYGLLYHGVNDA